MQQIAQVANQLQSMTAAAERVFEFLEEEEEDSEEEEEKPSKKSAKKKVEEEPEDSEEEDSEEEDSEEEETDDEDDSEEEETDGDEFDDMDRKELKHYIKENELEITVKKSMSDDDIRDLIREAVADSDDDWYIYKLFASNYCVRYFVFIRYYFDRDSGAFGGFDCSFRDFQCFRPRGDTAGKCAAFD